MARLAAVCVLAAVACLLNSMAFVPAPESRARAMDTGAMAAAAGVMAVGAPQNAEAFVFKGSFAASSRIETANSGQIGFKTKSFQISKDSGLLEVARPHHF